MDHQLDGQLPDVVVSIVRSDPNLQWRFKKSLCELKLAITAFWLRLEIVSHQRIRDVEALESRLRGSLGEGAVVWVLVVDSAEVVAAVNGAQRLIQNRVVIVGKATHALRGAFEVGRHRVVVEVFEIALVEGIQILLVEIHLIL